MKKYLSILITITLLSSMIFILSGCVENDEMKNQEMTQEKEESKKVEDKDEDKSEDNQQEVIQVEEEKNVENEELLKDDKEKSESTDKIEYVSTEDSLLVKEKATGLEILFRFDGDRIIACSMSMETESERDAKLQKAGLELEAEKTRLYEYRVEGNKLIADYKQVAIEEMFGNQTRTEIEEMFEVKE